MLTRPLQDFVKWSKLFMTGSQEERLTFLSMAIASQMGTHATGCILQQSEAAVRRLKKQSGSNCIRLGGLINQPGVCRHRSLLLKAVCDALNEEEASAAAAAGQPPPDLIKIRVVRGMIGPAGSAGAHAWNVLEDKGAS
jgi:hypothetical protein